MFTRISIFLGVLLLALPLGSCSDDDGMEDDMLFMGDSKTYALSARSDASISGTATFTENQDGSTTVLIDLNGTTSGSSPAHIHINSAAEGGDIAVSLEPVDGSTGMSSTTFSALDDGTTITYDQLLEFDGYINVHRSADDLATLIAQGDIGINELTGESKVYALGSRDVDGISGSLTLSKRVSGSALAVIELDGTPQDGMHPGHIHNNSAAEGGDIAFTFNPVVGASGRSETSVETLDDGTSITYEQLLEFDGYVNIHLSAEELSTLVAQGDIGINELTGESKTYELASKDIDGIQGTATFSERVSGKALAVIELEGTPEDGMHPGHIHLNTAAEGGAIAFTFNPVVGATGRSETSVEVLDDGTAISYEALLDFDGYINIHLSAEELSTLVAQGDIGQNEKTGNQRIFPLVSVSDPLIFGTVLFEERVNSETLVTIDLEGTQEGDLHPAHIHAGSVAEAPGAILVSLGEVVGATGMKMTNVSMKDDGMPITYEEMIAIDGYVNVHLSADDLATLVAQGNVGVNAE